MVGEEMLSHDAEKYMEAAKTALNDDRGLLSVLEGHDPPEVRCIIDIDLNSIPSLPNTHAAAPHS